MPPLTSLQKSCLALAIGNVLASAPVGATTINVDTGCTLIDAITSANTGVIGASSCEIGDSVGADVIVLPETIPAYTVSSDGYGVDNSALPTIASDITIQGVPSRTTIERNTASMEAFRIFSVGSGARLELNSVIVSGGAALQAAGIYVYSGELILDNTVISNNTATATGGGIYAYSQSTVTVRNGSTITLNNAVTGAGINIYDAGLTVENSTFSQNTAQTFGAISIQGSNTAVNLTNATIQDNTATVGGGGGLGIVGQDLGPGNLTALSIQGSNFTGNTANNDNGGAAYIQYMATQITDTSFSNNYAKTGGGALYLKGADSSLMLMSSTLQGNSTNLVSGSGGAICLGGTVAEITDTSLNSNRANLGGAVFATDSSIVSFDRGKVENNQATTAGGGIQHESNGLLLLTDFTIAENTSINANGGGINAVAGNLLINTSTISGNESGVSGGGVFHSGSSFEVYISTISGNSATMNGAGLYLSGISNKVINSTINQNSNSTSVFSTGTPFIVNTVVSSANSTDCTFGSGFAGSANNWFSDDSCSGIANGVPQLESLADNNNGFSGITKTHATAPSSPLLGAGLKSFCRSSGNAILASDQRGAPRVNCDIGAFERNQEACFVVKASNGNVLTFCL